MLTERIIYQDNEGNWTRATYDNQGNQVELRTSDGYWVQKTFDANNNQLTIKDSNGYSIDHQQVVSKWVKTDNRLSLDKETK
jgi:hypothetical protein